MEFDHVGKHCGFQYCHQRDFLPFTCDACHKSFCLQHRSYLTHDCEAAKLRDVTSLDCPVCGKSVRFTKAEDPNLVWEQHNANQCTQIPQPPSSSSSQRCCKAGCMTILGPSNTIQCPKCQKKVCISHRMAEDHQCTSLGSNGRAGFLHKFEQSNSSKSQSQIKPRDAKVATSSSGKSTSSSNNSSKNRQNNQDVSNTLKGTASRRMKGGDGSQARPIAIDIFVCPFCNIEQVSIEELNSHIMLSHDEDSGISNVQQPTVALPPNGGGYEICPICSKRFSDAVQLVAHFDSAHQENSRSNRNDTQQQSDSTGSGCRVV